MLPINECDSVSCLESLVGVRSDCVQGAKCPEYFIEDLEGVSLQTLSQVAKANNPSGTGFARDLIHAAANEMLGDLEGLIGNGYRLTDSFGDVCGAGQYQNVYQAGGGSIVRNVVGGQYSRINIFSMEMLTDFTGSAVLVLNDGTPKNYNVTLEAGVIIPVVDINYSTNKKEVKISFQDPSIKVAQISYAVKSGCGCGGGSSANASNSIRYEGMLGGAKSSTQYGFQICAAVVCSNEQMICQMIKQFPKFFGLTLLYKVGAKYYAEKKLSLRKNASTVQSNEADEQMQSQYEGYYETKMQGTKSQRGLRATISSTLQQSKDKCITCDGVRSIAYAAG